MSLTSISHFILAILFKEKTQINKRKVVYLSEGKDFLILPSHFTVDVKVSELLATLLSFLKMFPFEAWVAYRSHFISENSPLPKEGLSKDERVLFTALCRPDKGSPLHSLIQLWLQTSIELQRVWIVMESHSKYI